MHSLIKQSESVNVRETYFSIVFVYNSLYILINIKLFQAFVKQLQIITNKEYTYFQFSSTLGSMYSFFIIDQKSEGAARVNIP